MSLLPVLKVEINDSVSKEQATELIRTMKSLKGVFGVHANQKNEKSYLVTIASDDVLGEIRKLKGVKKANYTHII